MILDSSAVLAILFAEPGHERLIEKVLAADVVGIGAPTLAEIGVVLRARVVPNVGEMIEGFVCRCHVTVVPFGEDHWRVAVEAFGWFGQGRHPAGLTFGACMSYAVAKLAGRPLLYVGDAFAGTDLEAA